MKLIVAQCIEKKANEIGLSFDDLYQFVKSNRSHNFIKLCAPLNNTTAHKSYIDKSKRLLVFFIDKKSILYPVYIGDKHDKIAKNINIDVVRKEAENWHKKINSDFLHKKIKIRHF